MTTIFSTFTVPDLGVIDCYSLKQDAADLTSTSSSDAGKEISETKTEEPLVLNRKQRRLLKQLIESIKKFSDFHLNDSHLTKEISYLVAHPQIDRIVKKTSGLYWKFRKIGSRHFIHLKIKTGIGRFKITYLGLAVDLKEQRDSRVKLVAHQKLHSADPAATEKILDEIRIQQSFQHENIVKIYAYFISAKNISIYSHYCNGGDLDKYLETKDRLFEEKLSLMIDYVNGICYLHERLHAHNDLKPSNLMVHDQRGLITDFGTVLPFEKDLPYFCYSNCPPERKYDFDHIGQPKSSKECDAFQIGLVIYKTFFEEIPIVDKMPELGKLFAQPLKRIPAEIRLKELTLLCTEKNPNLRITMNEILRELNTIAIDYSI